MELISFEGDTLQEPCEGRLFAQNEQVFLLDECFFEIFRQLA